MATHVALSPHAIAATLARELRPWQPVRPIATEMAHLFLASQPMVRLENSGSDDGIEFLRGQTEAAFDSFIENGRPPRGLFKATFGRTGVSQMEILSPKPGVRLFGAFVIDDTRFVGLRLYLRNELPFKSTRQKGLIDYKTLGEELVKEWNALLPGVPRRPLKEL